VYCIFVHPKFELSPLFQCYNICKIYLYHLKEFGKLVLYGSKIIVFVKSTSSEVRNSKRLKSEILTAKRKTQLLILHA
jgi:hypothetical protein